MAFREPDWHLRGRVMADLDEFFASEELRMSLVRADPVEVWAPRLYALEALPGYTVFVRQALLCLCRDGRILYLETAVVGARLFRAKRWAGQVADLGKPLPVSIGFVAAKGIRLHHARDNSMVVTIDGSRKIIYFTGVMKARGLPKGFGGLKNIPQVGIVAGWVESAVVRARNPHSAHQGTFAAQAWRSVLNGNTRPEMLPPLFDHP
jgi:hypothetical protein